MQKPYVSLRQKAVSFIRWSLLLFALIASASMTTATFYGGNVKLWPLGWQLAAVGGLAVVLLCAICVILCAISSLIRESFLTWLRSWLAADDQRLKIK